jgi:hypothetical protein
MGVLGFILLVAALYGLAALVPTWLVTGERPTDRPREWPVGVQEADQAGYAVSKMAPRQPPEPITPVPTTRVGSHVSIRDG